MTNEGWRVDAPTEREWRIYRINRAADAIFDAAEGSVPLYIAEHLAQAAVDALDDQPAPAADDPHPEGIKRDGDTRWNSVVVDRPLTEQAINDAINSTSPPTESWPADRWDDLRADVAYRRGFGRDVTIVASSALADLLAERDGLAAKVERLRAKVEGYEALGKHYDVIEMARYADHYPDVAAALTEEDDRG
jgi:hypothetical protein